MSLPKAIASHLTYANVVATLALVGVLSGSASAAVLITSKQIKDNTILSRDIHNGTVNSKDIKDASIHAADLGIDSVDTQAILNGTVGADDLAYNSVYGDTVADGSLTGADLANGSINSGQLAAGAVTSGKIADGTITRADLAAGVAGPSYTPIGVVLAVGKNKVFSLGYFNFTANCKTNEIQVRLGTAITGSNFVMSESLNSTSMGLESTWTRAVVNSIEIYGAYTNLGDDDVVRFMASGITPSQDANGTRYGAWVSVQAIYTSSGCTFMGVMLPASP